MCGSSDPLARRVPSGLKATLFTESKCLSSVVVSSPWRCPTASLTVPRENPLANRVPSGLKATLLTDPACPRGQRCPLLWLRPRASPCRLPNRWRDASLSKLKATLLTAPKCPSMVAISSRVVAFHSFTEPSSEPLARTRPSGLKATLLTGSEMPCKGCDHPHQSPRPRASRCGRPTRWPIASRPD